MRPEPPKKTQWKKGQSGNPQGRGKDPPGFKKIKTLTKNELAEVANLILKGSVAQLKALANSGDASVIQVMIASVAVKIISRGDMVALNVLLDRLIGKVPANDELTLLFQRYETMTDEELARIAVGAKKEE